MNELAHGMAHVDLAWEDNEALQWTEPKGLLLIAIGEPGEESVGVGEYQTIDTQVATYGYQPIFLAQVWVGEPEIGV